MEDANPFVALKAAVRRFEGDRRPTYLMENLHNNWPRLVSLERDSEHAISLRSHSGQNILPQACRQMLQVAENNVAMTQTIQLQYPIFQPVQNSTETLAKESLRGV